LVLHKKLMKAQDSSKKKYIYGAAGAPDRDSAQLQKFSSKTAFA
jgi:hypothetical protein